MIAFLFAGQGAQYIGMGKDLYESFPESRDIFDRADKALGFSLSRFCFEGPEDKLKATDICQPAVLTVSIAALEAFRRVMPSKAEYVSGLSLGEYSALVAAEVLRFEDAVRLVRKRAELMNAACLKYPGTMAAVIGLERQIVQQICLVSGRVEMANLNAPGQIVISGEKEAVLKAKALALEKGAKTVIDLEVSGAFHSSLMREAAENFKDFLDQGIEFHQARLPVVSNVDALPATDISQIKGKLVKQISSSVLWEDAMRFILSAGTKKFYEFGPGKVLKGLMRRIDPGAEVVTIERKEDIIKVTPNLIG